MHFPGNFYTQLGLLLVAIIYTITQIENLNGTFRFEPKTLKKKRKKKEIANWVSLNRYHDIVIRPDNTQMVFIVTRNVVTSTIISPKHNKFDPSIYNDRPNVNRLTEDIFFYLKKKH